MRLFATLSPSALRSAEPCVLLDALTRSRCVHAAGPFGTPLDGCPFALQSLRARLLSSTSY